MILVVRWVGEGRIVHSVCSSPVRSLPLSVRRGTVVRCVLVMFHSNPLIEAMKSSYDVDDVLLPAVLGRLSGG